jgi:peptide-methionine (S)-S-oxide reductase
VGYAGGTTSNPTYSNIGNYSETVQVDYDPTIVSYEQLLSAFWDDAGVTYTPYSIQYRAAIFYTTDHQQIIAEASKTGEETRLGRRTFVSIEPGTNFYTAEDYHQKFYLRERKDLVNAIYAIYPDAADFRDSTAAARLNGYLGGYGDLNSLKQNLSKLGLNEAGQKALLDVANAGLTQACPVVIPGG